jgi:MarR family transcriptional regulator for hemolysin
MSIDIEVSATLPLVSQSANTESTPGGVAEPPAAGEATPGAVAEPAGPGNPAPPDTAEPAGSGEAVPSPRGRPTAEPIGRAVSSAAKVLNRAFTDQLAEAGGSQHVWLILLTLKQQSWRTQQEIAAAVGIEGPTLTHHLDRLDKAGLIQRARDPEDRRAVRVELTAAGDELFHRLASAAMAFDQRLRAGLSDDEIDTCRRVLARLRENVVEAQPPRSKK